MKFSVQLYWWDLPNSGHNFCSSIWWRR